MYTNVNNFSEPNFRSQLIALIASSNLSLDDQKRCVRLLPEFVNYDQLRGIELLLRQRVCGDQFLSSFDMIFHVSMWQSFCDQMYALTFEPIVDTVRYLLR